MPGPKGRKGDPVSYYNIIICVSISTVIICYAMVQATNGTDGDKGEKGSVGMIGREGKKVVFTHP